MAPFDLLQNFTFEAELVSIYKSRCRRSFGSIASIEDAIQDGKRKFRIEA